MPYSALAIDANESPSTTVWARVASKPPDVGFCRGGLVSSSCIDTLHEARIGRPSGRNRVSVVVTDLTTPTNGVAVPHENTTIGGYGVSLLSDFSVGRTVLSSLSIVLATSPVSSSVASRNISTSSVRSWVPVNSGCSPAFLLALKFQLALQRGRCSPWG